jgi:hypothetical protein
MAVYNSKDKLAYFKDNKQTHESPVRNCLSEVLPFQLPAFADSARWSGGVRYDEILLQP